MGAKKILNKIEVERTRCAMCGRLFNPRAKGATLIYGAACAAKAEAGVSPRTSIATEGDSVDSRQLDLFNDWSPKQAKEVERKAFEKEVKTSLKIKEIVSDPEAGGEELVIDEGKKGSSTTYDTKSGFKWARESEVKGYGVETVGAARHKRNAGRDWDDVLKNAGEAVENEEVLAPMLVKSIKNNLSGVVNEENDARLAVLGLVLGKFPSKIPDLKEESLRRYHALTKGLVFDIMTLNEQHKDPSEFLLAARELFRKNRRDFSRGEDYAFGGVNHALYNKFRSPKGIVFEINSLLKAKNIIGERGVNPFTDPQAFDSSMGLAKGKFQDYARGILKGAGIKKVLGIKAPPRIKSGVKLKTYRHSDLSKSFAGKIKKMEFKSFKDASDFLKKKMNVKGYDFGNSVPDKERLDLIKKTAQSFKDLSKLTGLSPEQLTGKGELRVLFAVKGTPGNSATYWYQTRDININRGSIGSIAHEMGHYLDDLAGRRVKGKSFISDASISDETASGLERAYSSIRSEMNEFRGRMKENIAYKEYTSASRKKLESEVELFARCFERYVLKKASKKKITNEVLVCGANSFLYPNEEELAKMEPLFDDMLKELKKVI